MEQIIAVILPILIILAAGYGSVFFKMLERSHIQAISQYIIKIALPAFLLHALSTRPFAEIWQAPYFFAYLIGSLLLFFGTYLLYRKWIQLPQTQAAVMGFGGSMSNTGFIGTAVLTLLIGQAAVPYLAMTLMIENIIMLTLMLVLAESGLSQHKSLHELCYASLKNISKNPVILSIIFGLIGSMLSIQWPDAVAFSLKSLAATASPLAILVIGANLAGLDLKQIGQDVTIMCSIKLLLMPLVIGTALYLMPATTPQMLYAGIILAALPMASAFGIYGQIYGIPERSAAPVMFSTLLSLLVIAAILHFVPSPF